MQMVFRFDPNQSEAPLPRGRHPARLSSAEPRTSKAGNEMLELTFVTTGAHGETVALRDYLVSTPRAKWKIKRFCKAAGVDYTRGEIEAEQIVGKEVDLEVSVEEDRDGRDRNVVIDYYPVASPGSAPTVGGGDHGRQEGARGPATERRPEEASDRPRTEVMPGANPDDGEMKIPF